MTAQIGAATEPTKVKTARLGLLSIADQALSSVTNFGVAFIAIASLSSHEYAYYSVATVVMLTSIAVLRSYAIESAIIASGATHALNWSIVAGRVLMVSLPMALLAAATIPTAPADWRPVLVALVLLPGVGLFELGRFRAFADRRLEWACAMDACWGIGSVLLALVARAASAGPTLFVCAWAGVGASIGVIVLAVVRSRRPDRLDPPTSRSARALVTDTLLENVSLWGLLVIAAAVGGTGLVASFNAGRLLFGPLTVLVLATPAFYAALSRGPGDHRPMVVWAGPLLLVGGAGALLVLGLRLAEGPLGATVGETWERASPTIVPLGAFLTAYALIQVARQQIRYFADIATTAPLRLLTIAALWVAATAGALVAPGSRTTGFAVALAIAGALLCSRWILLSKTAVEHRLSPGRAPTPTHH